MSPPKCTGDVARLTGKHPMKHMVLISEENGIKVWSCSVCPGMHVEFPEDDSD